MGSLGDKLKMAIENGLKFLKIKIFGNNNERLDFVMDSFYKLAPAQRNGVIAIGAGIVLFFIFAAVFIYFGQVKSLEREIGESIAALQEIKKFKQQDQSEEKRFSMLVDTIKKKTRNISFKPYFEKLSKEKSINIRDLVEKETELEANNPLVDTIKEVQIEIRFPEISIPRLLAFVTEVEKEEHYIRLQDLKITGQYGNKLYFDTALTFRGYQTKK